MSFFEGGLSEGKGVLERYIQRVCVCLCVCVGEIEREGEERKKKQCL